MIREKVELYKFDLEDKCAATSLVHSFIQRNFNGLCKVVVNGDVVMKRKILFAYNSFFPDIEISESNDGYVRIVYKFPCGFGLKLFCFINLFFLLVLGVISISDGNGWIFCAIPIGTMLFLIGFSYLVFSVSVNLFSKRFQEEHKGRIEITEKVKNTRDG